MTVHGRTIVGLVALSAMSMGASGGSCQGVDPADLQDSRVTYTKVSSATGVVLAGDTAVPVAGASVRIGDVSAVTDADGYFSMRDLDAGKATVRIAAYGFDTLITEVELAAGANALGVIRLAAACAGGLADCNGVASDGCEVTVETDPANCGVCGNVCPLDQTCSLGQCVPLACTAPQADCNHIASDGCETNLDGDASSCGACGKSCAAGERCFGGSCLNVVAAVDKAASLAAVDDDHVYWIEAPSKDALGNVNGDGVVGRTSLIDGSVDVLDSGLTATPDELHLSSGGVFWVDRETNHLVHVDKATAALDGTALTSDAGMLVAVDDASLYWRMSTGAGSAYQSYVYEIRASPLSAPATQVVLTTFEDYELTFLGQDATSLYFGGGKGRVIAKTTGAVTNEPGLFWMMRDALGFAATADALYAYYWSPPSIPPVAVTEQGRGAIAAQWLDKPPRTISKPDRHALARTADSILWASWTSEPRAPFQLHRQSLADRGTTTVFAAASEFTFRLTAHDVYIGLTDPVDGTLDVVRIALPSLCSYGTADCNGVADDDCEVVLSGDRTNCGACGVACGADEVCSASQCTPLSCTAPAADCNHLAADGCERNLQTDPGACGACGTICATGDQCIAGRCRHVIAESRAGLRLLQIDGDYLYWTNDPTRDSLGNVNGDGLVARTSLVNETTETLASTFAAPVSPLMNTTDLYWLDGMSINRMNKATHAVDVLTTVSNAAGGAILAGLDDAKLYVFAQTAVASGYAKSLFELRTISVAQPSRVVVLATLEDYWAHPRGDDDTAVYVMGASTSYIVAKADGTVTPASFGGPGTYRNIYGFIPAPTMIYVMESDVMSSGGTTVTQQARGSSAATVIDKSATTLPNSTEPALALTADSLQWAAWFPRSSGADTFVLKRMTLADGGKSTVFEAATEFGFRARTGEVFLSLADGAAGKSRIIRLPTP